MERLRAVIIFTILLSVYGAWCQQQNVLVLSFSEICGKYGTTNCSKGGCKNNTPWSCEKNNTCALISRSVSDNRNQTDIDNLGAFLWNSLQEGTNLTQECFKETCQSPAAYTFKLQACDHPSGIQRTGTNKNKVTIRPPRIETYTEDEIEMPGFQCKQDEAFKVDCNTCWCRLDGKGPKYCTRISCHPKVYKPLTARN